MKYNTEKVRSLTFLFTFIFGICAFVFLIGRGCVISAKEQRQEVMKQNCNEK